MGFLMIWDGFFFSDGTGRNGISHGLVEYLIYILLCLKKARDRGSYKVRLTSNTDDIDEVVLGVELMAKILEQAASRDLYPTLA